jgi:hypothetical protein
VIGRVDGLVTSDKEVRKLMLDREAWRSRIKIIVTANKGVGDALKLVLLLSPLIELRHTFSRLFVVCCALSLKC